MATTSITITDTESGKEITVEVTRTDDPGVTPEQEQKIEDLARKYARTINNVLHYKCTETE